ncbi:MAG TPA: S8 family serine peptidase [Pseudonocardiaceae bacterium]|nr:S8 family serine peptidase [Pseudonocardiaceae bacterium]
MQLTARTAAVITAVVLLAAGSAAHPSASVAHAQPGERPVCAADLPRLRYVVLFAEATERAAAEAAIHAACGAPVVFYPEIAVAVASTTDSAFADRIGRDRAYSAQAEALTGTEPPASTVRAASRSGRALVGVTAPKREQRGEAEPWNLAMIRAGKAHEVTAGSREVLVGVLDSGVDANHPELRAAVDRSASAGCTTGKPDPGPSSWRPSSPHGTHVAGLIVAAADGAGVTGVAPGVRIASVKVVDEGGYIYPEYAVCGFVWAARQGMRITNNSYFVDPWLFTCRDQPGQAVAHEAVRRAAAYATASGVLSVAAVGNEAADLAYPGVDTRSPNNAKQPRRRPVDETCDVLPAGLPGVLAVSAVGAQGVKSSYSSYGAGVVDLTAPGGDVRQRAVGQASGCVLSTMPGGGYGRMCGTSMATPHVAGVAALVASQHPKAGPDELTRAVVGSASPLGCPGRYDPNSDGRSDASCTADGEGNGFYGHGMLDALAAVSR